MILMKKPMPTYRFFVGIDVSKLTLDLHLYDLQTGHYNRITLDNNSEGFAKMHLWLYQCAALPGQTLLCSEHTGRYGEHLRHWLAGSQWQHGVLNTTALAKVSPEHHRKTDSYDAELLSEYARRFCDKITLAQPVPERISQLERLHRERRHMVDNRASLRQKLSEMQYHQANTALIEQFYTDQIQLLTRHITQIDTCIKELISDDLQLNALYQRLIGIPGIGPVIACQWLCLFFQHEKLNPRKISSRFGFAPHEIESGSSVHKRKRSTSHGNPELRRMMFMAARSVVQHKAHFKEYYNRKMLEGKPHRVILNNVINKLIRMVCSIWNHQSSYDPNYVLTMKLEAS
jgi:transposase